MKKEISNVLIATPRYGVKGIRILTMPAVAGELLNYGREFNINLIDNNLDDINPDEKIDLLCLSALSYNFPYAVKIAREFKRYQPETPIILGGPYATIMLRGLRGREGHNEKEILERLRGEFNGKALFDSIICGEMEGLGGKILSGVEACINGRPNELNPFYESEHPPDMAILPRPRVELLDKWKYIPRGFPIELTRGCKNACNFCGQWILYPTFRTNTEANIRRDIEARDMDLIALADLNVGADIDALIRFTRIIKEYKLKWGAQMCIDVLDNDIFLDIVAGSGFQAYVGLETISRQGLASINKLRVNAGFENPVERYKRIIRKAKLLAGITVASGFITGLDNVDINTCKDSIDFFEEVGIAYITPTDLTYYPGTPIHKSLVEMGRIEPNFPLEKTDGLHIMMTPNNRSKEDVYKEKEYILDNFYSFRSIINRAWKNKFDNFIDLIGFFSENLWFKSWYDFYTGKKWWIPKTRFKDGEKNKKKGERENGGKGEGEDGKFYVSKLGKSLNLLMAAMSPSKIEYKDGKLVADFRYKHSLMRNEELFKKHMEEDTYQLSGWFTLLHYYLDAKFKLRKWKEKHKFD